MKQRILHHFSGVRGSLALSMAVLFIGGAFVEGEEPAKNSSLPNRSFPGLPEAVREENFSVLKSNSPFLRSLDLSEFLILTGVARIGGNVLVTLYERETKETHIVSEIANLEGWRLIDVGGDESDLETVTAQVSIGGGEVFSVRYDERQLRPDTARPGGGSGSSGQGGKPPVPERDYREGISGDGFRGAPPPELVKKLSQLTEDDRNRLIQQIREIRDKGVSSEERRVLFGRIVDRALQQGR